MRDYAIGESLPANLSRRATVRACTPRGVFGQANMLFKSASQFWDNPIHIGWCFSGKGLDAKLLDARL